MPNNYTNIAICSPGYDFDCDDFNKRHSETNFCKLLKPMPVELEGTVSPRDTPNWYTWCKENWGTKWGLGGIIQNPAATDGRCLWRQA